MKKISVGWIVMLLIVLVLAGCRREDLVIHKSPAIPQELVNSIQKRDNFAIKKIPYELLDRTCQPIAPLTPDFPTDGHGIELWEYKGGMYYHPLRMARIGMQYLDSYRQTQNTQYLTMARAYVDKLLELATKVGDDKLLFPYAFDFALHGMPEDVMRAPWHSGMTQGTVLLFFVRFYDVTKEDLYLFLADKVFAGLYELKAANKPWVTKIDEDGYFWVEEYPDEVDTHALNGFIFAIYGLYEYYEVTKSAESKFLLQAALTTVKDHIHLFRNPGGISYYCLKHKVKSLKYHLIHIKQFKYLYNMTGDRYFKKMSDTFYSDNHDELKTAPTTQSLQGIDDLE